MILKLSGFLTSGSPRLVSCHFFSGPQRFTSPSSSGCRTVEKFIQREAWERVWRLAVDQARPGPAQPSPARQAHTDPWPHLIYRVSQKPWRSYICFVNVSAGEVSSAETLSSQSCKKPKKIDIFKLVNRLDLRPHHAAQRPARCARQPPGNFSPVDNIWNGSHSCVLWTLLSHDVPQADAASLPTWLGPRGGQECRSADLEPALIPDRQLWMCPVLAGRSEKLPDGFQWLSVW